MTTEQENRLLEMIKTDDTYQSLLAECGKLEKDYLRIIHTLTETDREILDKYIGVCEELEHQKVILSFQVR